VTVNNVAPVLGSLAATTINENGATTLTGTITDPGTPDTFTLDVNWGDPLSPNNVQQVTFAAGTTSFTLTHQYLDDNPTARFRRVRTGRILGERVEIISGIKTGDRYVVQPPQGMQDGVTVEVPS